MPLSRVATLNFPKNISRNMLAFRRKKRILWKKHAIYYGQPIDILRRRKSKLDHHALFYSFTEEHIIIPGHTAERNCE